MKQSFILILYLIFTAKSQYINIQYYSIDSFIKYLQKNRFFEIFSEIKLFFGVDVSIEMCKNLVKSPHCEEVIRVYITYNPHNTSRAAPLFDLNFEEFIQERNYVEIFEKVIPNAEILIKRMINNQKLKEIEKLEIPIED